MIRLGARGAHTRFHIGAHLQQAGQVVICSGVNDECNFDECWIWPTGHLWKDL